MLPSLPPSLLPSLPEGAAEDGGEGGKEGGREVVHGQERGLLGWGRRGEGPSAKGEREGGREEGREGEKECDEVSAISKRENNLSMNKCMINTSSFLPFLPPSLSPALLGRQTGRQWPLLLLFLLQLMPPSLPPSLPPFAFDFQQRAIQPIVCCLHQHVRCRRKREGGREEGREGGIG